MNIEKNTDVEETSTSVEDLNEESMDEETTEGEDDSASEESEVSEEPKSEMHKIKCSECGKDAEVPFTPTEGRPVYCRDCFMKHRKPRRSFGYNNNNRRY